MDCVERIESLTVEDFISVSVCLHFYFNFIFVYVSILFINIMMDVTLSSKDYLVLVPPQEQKIIDSSNKKNIGKNLVLIKIWCKILNILWQVLNKCAYNLVIFFVRLLSLTYFKIYHVFRCGYGVGLTLEFLFHKFAKKGRSQVNIQSYKRYQV